MKEVEVLGGQIIEHALNLELFKKSERAYKVCKGIVWEDMLRQAMRPKRWFKPGKYGTKINFETIHTVQEAKAAIEELKAYFDGLKSESEEAGQQ